MVIVIHGGNKNQYWFQKRSRASKITGKTAKAKYKYSSKCSARIYLGNHIPNKYDKLEANLNCYRSGVKWELNGVFINVEVATLSISLAVQW